MPLWLGLTWIDWLVLAVYLVGVTAIGVWTVRRVKNTTDFFMGGRRFGKVFMMFFAFGAGTHSEQAVSVVAGTWRAGLAGIWWQFIWLWATPFYWIIAPVLRRMRALTTADFFQARYGTSTASLYACCGILMAVVTLSGVLYGSGKMVNALTGGELERVAETHSEQLRIVPIVSLGAEASLSLRPLRGYEIAILAITVLFLIYGLAGGLSAAIITDFVQGILTIVFSFILLPWLLWKVGWSLESPGEIKLFMFDLFGRAETAEILGKEPITVFHVFMLSVATLIGIVAQPHIMGVCGAGKTEFEGRFGFTVGNFLKRFCTIAWMLIGLCCIIWYLGADSPLKNSTKAEDRELYQQLRMVAKGEHKDPGNIEQQKKLDGIDLDFADGLFGRAAYELLPAGLVGLLLASLLAAMMSTCDAQMVVASGLFTENIYKRFFGPHRTETHYLWVGRMAAILIVIAALLLQTTFTDVIDALKVILKTPAAIGISIWLGIVWRRWTTPAVWASALSAYAAWAIVAKAPVFAPQALEFLHTHDTWNFMTIEINDVVRFREAWVNVVYLGTGLSIGIITCLLTRRAPKEKLDRFYRVMRTPVKLGEVVTEPCTLPENAGEPVPKWFDHPDIEIPRPTKMDLLGFLAAWAMVGLIILFVVWLAS